MAAHYKFTTYSCTYIHSVESRTD